MTEKRKGMILIGLLAVVGTVWYVDTHGGAIPKVSNAPDRSYTPLQVDSLALRADKLERSRGTEYQSSGRDLFSEAPVVVADNRPRKPVEPHPEPVGPQIPPPPEPAKLPANVKYFGYGTVP